MGEKLEQTEAPRKKKSEVKSISVLGGWRYGFLSCLW